jgi:pyruvate dehydrogenase E2 component (dihydrolipoamide acetyltransferase)
LNAYWIGETIVTPSDIHIAVAIDTEAGLLLPVIREVTGKSIQQIAVEARLLREQAQTNQLSPDDALGGTFTVYDLGMYGVDAFAPIINMPQCAILGIGQVISKPAEYNDEIVPRKMMVLSLSFDHRIVDGGPAARFLSAIRGYIERPFLWLTQ